MLQGLQRCYRPKSRTLHRRSEGCQLQWWRLFPGKVFLISNFSYRWGSVVNACQSYSYDLSYTLVFSVWFAWVTDQHRRVGAFDIGTISGALHNRTGVVSSAPSPPTPPGGAVSLHLETPNTKTLIEAVCEQYKSTKPPDPCCNHTDFVLDGHWPLGARVMDLIWRWLRADWLCIDPRLCIHRNDHGERNSLLKRDACCARESYTWAGISWWLSSRYRCKFGRRMSI